MPLNPVMQGRGGGKKKKKGGKAAATGLLLQWQRRRRGEGNRAGLFYLLREEKKRKKSTSATSAYSSCLFFADREGGNELGDRLVLDPHSPAKKGERGGKAGGTQGSRFFSYHLFILTGHHQVHLSLNKKKGKGGRKEREGKEESLAVKAFSARPEEEKERPSLGSSC